ncbi:MAG: PHP domain-containing protein, partial [Myxococcales bacterium]|nr:PHP domain-containing protein [Myxococcales bacterium]
VEITSGQDTPATFTLARVVDTTGWIAGDFHVHSTNSDDSPTPLRDRVTSFLGVGVEFFAATDHDFISDYAPVIEAMGVRDRIGSMTGNEISTLTMGHFNGYPLTRDPTRGDFGALDWRGLTAGEIYDAILGEPGAQVAQMNHPRSDSLKGHLTAIGYDPATGTASQGVVYTNFNAIEVNLEDEVRADWFSFLNMGFNPTAMGNSDTHRTFRGGPGFPVNYLRVGRDDPLGIHADDVVEAILTHRVIQTNGPFVELEINDRPVGSTIVDTDGAARAHVRIQAPPWMDVNTLSVFVNGALERTIAVAGSQEVVRYDGSFDIPLSRDSWVVVEVKGAGTFAPRNGGAPKALTNPIWVDTDGLGFTPPGL